MAATFQIGDMSLTFHLTRHETGGAMDLYELILPVGSRSFVPHFHREYEETIIGVDGISHWVLDGEHIEIGPGEKLVIQRGVVHCVLNLHQTPARMMCLTTPGMLGPEYFRDLSEVDPSSENPDPAKFAAVMARYGVIPVASWKQ
jgi:mannose-6-phosphate isomerase-like protein (cupin superfamily)